MTILALIPAAFMFAIGTVMGKTMTKTWEKRQQAFSDLSDFAQENFSGIAVIKAFVKELKSSSLSANSTKTTKRSTWSIPASRYCSK